MKFASDLQVQVDIHIRSAGISGTTRAQGQRSSVVIGSSDVLDGEWMDDMHDTIKALTNEVAADVTYQLGKIKQRAEQEADAA